jgi:hypothetical protein
MSQLDNIFQTPLIAICLVDFHDVKCFITAPVHLSAVLCGVVQPSGYVSAVTAVSTPKSYQSWI